MPFKSKAQARFMFSQHPKMAKEWASKTNFSKLPDYLNAKHSHPFSMDPSGPNCLMCGGSKQSHRIK